LEQDQIIQLKIKVVNLRIALCNKRDTIKRNCILQRTKNGLSMKAGLSNENTKRCPALTNLPCFFVLRCVLAVLMMSGFLVINAPPHTSD
jgi:hypothetical protein